MSSVFASGFGLVGSWRLTAAETCLPIRSPRLRSLPQDGTESTFTTAGSRGKQGLAFDAMGNLLVADSNSSALLKFNLERSANQFGFRLGGAGRSSLSTQPITYLLPSLVAMGRPPARSSNLLQVDRQVRSRPDSLPSTWPSNRACRFQLSSVPSRNALRLESRSFTKSLPRPRRQAIPRRVFHRVSVSTHCSAPSSALPLSQERVKSHSVQLIRQDRAARP